MQSPSSLFLTLLFYLRDNVKSTEHCDWIMVSCCKINAEAFIENKCWRKSRTFIFKVENYFLVTTFNGKDIITISPNGFLSKLRSPKESSRITHLFSLIKRQYAAFFLQIADQNQICCLFGGEQWKSSLTIYSISSSLMVQTWFLTFIKQREFE